MTEFSSKPPQPSFMGRFLSHPVMFAYATVLLTVACAAVGIHLFGHPVAAILSSYAVTSVVVFVTAFYAWYHRRNRGQ